MEVINQRRDVMVDIETLSTGRDAKIIQVAAIAFDITTGVVSQTLEFKVRLEGDLSVEADTLKWWMNQPEVLKNIILSDDAVHEEAAQRLLWKFLSPEGTTLWGNGILFDNAKIKDWLRKDYPVAYNKDRDLRTLLDMAALVTGKSEEEIKGMVSQSGDTDHDAFSDAMKQVRLACTCITLIRQEQANG